MDSQVAFHLEGARYRMAAVMWLVAIVSLNWGAYQILGHPGIFIACGLCALASAMAQEIRVAKFVAIDILDIAKKLNHE